MPILSLLQKAKKISHFLNSFREKVNFYKLFYEKYSIYSKNGALILKKLFKFF